MKQWLHPIHFALAMGFALSSCDSQKDPVDNRLPVAATTTLVADMVEDIGGGHVRVVTLMPAGANPHTYEPSRKEQHRLHETKLAFTNGLQLEEGLAELLEDYKHKGGTVLELASAINAANSRKLA